MPFALTKKEAAHSDSIASFTKATYVQYVLFNVIAALCVQVGHRTLYYMLGVSQWFFHFVHYLCPFLFLLGLSLLGCVKRRKIPIAELIPVSLSQLAVSTATCVVHSGGKYGTLHTLRLSDFAITLLVVQLMPAFCGRFLHQSYRKLMVLLAVSSSLAWFDLDLLETSWFAIAALPVYVFGSAMHYLIVYSKQRKLKVTASEFMLYHFGLTALFLFPMAFFCSVDSFNPTLENRLSLDSISVWAPFDYSVPLCGFIFHSALTFSKYWLMGNLNPETFVVTRHFKYTLAAFAQLFAINAIYSTAFTAFAKLAAVCFSLGFFWKKNEESSMRRRSSHDSAADGSLIVSNGFSHLNGNAKFKASLNGHAGNGYYTNEVDL